jgi:TolB-like protein/Tfp pilus assembly protein PilF
MMSTMAGRSSTQELGNDLDARVLEQLNRIFVGRAFRQADRLKRFLKFVVDETIAGRGERLKEFVIGVEVFEKDETFDPRNDPIVRVQARRLRAQLARYYREEGHADEVLIELPKGGYAPVFCPMKTAGQRRTIASTLVSRNAVVVIPFADHSAAADQGYFCRGLTEEIIHKLASTDGVRLVSQSPATGPADRPNAALMVTGSVRKARTEVRIIANLVDAGNGSYLWSGAVQRSLDDIFAVQDEIARMIADVLKSELTSGVHARGSRSPTENLAAYNLYLQARYHLSQRTEEGLRKAAEFFEKALIEDAQYAEAYSGLADAYSLLGHYGALSPAEVWTKAASNAAWAVLHNEESAEAHTSLAHVKATQDWDWQGAEREFQRAIALNPRYPAAHHWYALSCLAPWGRLDQAAEEVDLAQALDPISSIIARDVARIHYYKQDYDAALEQCDHAIELNPHFSPAYWILGLVQEQRADFDEAAAAFNRGLQLSPQSPVMQAALGRTFARSGKKADALRILKKLQQLAESRYVSPFEMASLHFALGRDDEGFQMLAKAFQDRCFELICLKVDPRWQSLRGNPRFHRLFEQLGLP